MFKRSMIRVIAALVTFVTGVVVSARAALAVKLPDPIGPVQHEAPGPGRLGLAAGQSSSFAVLGMDWELALAVALVAVAAALFLATAVQRRHLARP